MGQQTTHRTNQLRQSGCIYIYKSQDDDNGNDENANADDGDDGDDGDDDGDIYIMLCLSVCLSQKNHHFPLLS